ncbi:hypothetical protein BS17DRAFT_700280 [Gyrodon lividus]|nr:hypothetical protein BS17DRAFT_700280 [Gyrodon lividus]
MCPNLCLTHVGPDADHEVCPTCGEFHFGQVKLQLSNGRVKAPCAVFNTIPLGPQLQALFRDCETAQKMHYGEQHTQEISQGLNQNKGLVSAYNDVLTQSTYLEAVQNGKIQPKDMLVVLSIDGRIYIWIILTHCPDKHYKKKNVLLGAIIPRPNKPKFIKSFLYPGFHDPSAIQREGLTIWVSHPENFTTL